ncbi:ferritin-like domain-containing protein [Dactylonectria estremocensis]|uniref:Ferritin-like domain-containing protein n=1 Tax=Dactylonectria estremocensis TaxID=1079267 RepID=A0A9P9FK99_9HYPO|nr:ferritin-like domain-containing protein [Dactylonectria estremocensis]
MMMLRSLCLVAGLATTAIAAPVEERAVAAPPGGDITILNYALALEFLERKFYQQGIQKFSKNDFCNAGFDEEFYPNLKNIYADEKTHVTFLATALGDKAIGEPTFKFPFTDIHSFVGLAGVLEGVGVSAYLGAAAAIANKDYLTAAGSILTVEARHASYIRAALGQKPFPTAFDTPLDFNQVYSLAAQFITALAPNTKLPFKAFPTLTAADPTHSSFKAGGKVVFKGAYKAAKKAGKTNKPLYAVFFSGLNTYYVPVKIGGNKIDYVANIPKASTGKPAPAGQVYITLSSADGKKVTAGDENTVAGVAIIEVV